MRAMFRGCVVIYNDAPGAFRECIRYMNQEYGYKPAPAQIDFTGPMPLVRSKVTPCPCELYEPLPGDLVIIGMSKETTAPKLQTSAMQRFILALAKGGVKIEEIGERWRIHRKNKPCVKHQNRALAQVEALVQAGKARVEDGVLYAVE